ncbi:serine hydrolase domain-containing protein [Pseudonocardia broussonetiae]|uniref:Beta-lactamase family protein n=1 Tax=Pseudonocardia broussonetiae TaxID=2736640 RepID=A0A6M6JMC0_9PSEU|nr:serine hydrolase domain-containing protein [Pseudonocardia broussonetiae]QJY48465.1 beta-lactamase family protein [Pseudonocardia broussonetiae]
MTSTGPRHRTLLAVAVAALLWATGCGAPVAAAPAAAPAADPPVPAYAADLAPRLEALAQEMLVTGAVVLVRSPELGDWSTTIGTREHRGTEPVQLGDHVRVGSNTKTWTGTVVLQLVDEGRLGLDDPISTYVPDVPNGDAITLAHLLSMRSGLDNYTEALELNEAMDADPARSYAPQELLDMAFRRPPLYPPGEGYNYSNTNTVLLGLVIEQVTGNPVAEEFRTRLFAPLGMDGSAFPDRDSAALADPHPRGYTFGGNVETIDSLVLPDDVQARARAGTLAPTDVTDANPSWGWTAGAGISTAEDLADYVRALAGGGLLGPELQQQRLDSVRPVDPADPASPGYGLGLARFGTLYGHSGELPGFNSFMGHDPERDITVVTWTSLAPSVDGRGPAVELAKAVIGALYAP